LYYVFTTDAQVGYMTGNDGKLCYSIVDMSLSGGLGEVIVKNTVLRSQMVEKLTACKAANGTDFWIIAHGWNSNTFYAYLLSSSGISPVVVSSIGITYYDAAFNSKNLEAVGCMKVSPNGKKLAAAIYGSLNAVQIFNFDNALGILSNTPITDTDYPDSSLGFNSSDGPYGISFSPDNSKLYVSEFGNYKESGISHVYQYNMNAGSNAATLSTRTIIATSYNESYGALQLGPDGKIYLAKINDAGSHYLDVINNPNDLGAACNFNANQVYLGSGASSDFGLPNNIDSYLITSIEPYSSDHVSVYPNPVSHKLTIDGLSGISGIHAAEIYNMLGRQVYKLSSSNFQLSSSIDVSFLSSSMYFLQLKGEGGSVVKKFVKE